MGLYEVPLGPRSPGSRSLKQILNMYTAHHICTSLTIIFLPANSEPFKASIAAFTDTSSS